MNNLRKLYIDLDLEKQIETKDQTWNQLLETQDLFQEQTFAMAWQIVSKVIDQKNISALKFIQSGVFDKFHSLLCNSSEIGETLVIIKYFLIVFLKFEVGSNNHYSWNNSLFVGLVRVIMITLESYIYLLKSFFTDNTKMHTDLSSKTEPFQKELITTLNLLYLCFEYQLAPMV